MGWIAFAIIFVALLFNFPRAMGFLIVGAVGLAIVGFLYLWWENSNQSNQAAQSNAAAAAQAAAQAAAEDKARQAAAAEQARQQELARDAEAAFEDRRRLALKSIRLSNGAIRCSSGYALGCDTYVVSAIARNSSSETITHLSLGLITTPSDMRQCPSYIQLTYSEDLNLRPSETTFIELKIYNGMSLPPNFRYCLKVTDVSIARN